MVHTPTSTAELATTLRSLSERGRRVRVVGGGTKQGWGRSVEADDHLSVAALNRFREHVWQDMTCTVDAGISWATMQATLAQHGQRVALDPLFADRATVGGVIATNDSGSLRLKYGSLRDLVIGMTIVLPDGTIAKSGGKVVKNVAGYDLPKLMIGAFGTLGVIAEVTFRLHAIPRHTRHFTLSGATGLLGETMLALGASQLNLEALQMRADDAGSHLDVALSGMPEVVEQQRAMLQGFMEVGVDVWSAREAMFRETEAPVVKISVLPTEIGAAVTKVVELGGRAVAQSTGLVTAALPSASDLEAVRASVAAAERSVVVLQRPAGSYDDVWGAAPDSLPLMRAIKDRFDPKRTLNPGIFLDGI